MIVFKIVRQQMSNLVDLSTPETVEKEFVELNHAPGTEPKPQLLIEQMGDFLNSKLTSDLSVSSAVFWKTFASNDDFPSGNVAHIVFNLLLTLNKERNDSIRELDALKKELISVHAELERAKSNTGGASIKSPTWWSGSPNISVEPVMSSLGSAGTKSDAINTPISPVTTSLNSWWGAKKLGANENRELASPGVTATNGAIVLKGSNLPASEGFNPVQNHIDSFTAAQNKTPAVRASWWTSKTNAAPKITSKISTTEMDSGNPMPKTASNFSLNSVTAIRVNPPTAETKPAPSKSNWWANMKPNPTAISPTTQLSNESKINEMKQERIVLEQMIKQLRAEVSAYSHRESIYTEWCAKDAFELIEQIFCLSQELSDWQAKLQEFEGDMNSKTEKISELSNKVTSLETTEKLYVALQAAHADLETEISKMQLGFKSRDVLSSLSQEGAQDTTHSTGDQTTRDSAAPTTAIDRQHQEIVQKDEMPHKGIKELQCNLNQSEPGRVESEKKFKVEFEDAIEIERSTLQVEIDKLRKKLIAAENTGIESRKKVENELKAKMDEIAKLVQKVKSLETELSTAKSNHDKIIEELNIKLGDLTKTSNMYRPERSSAESKLQLELSEATKKLEDIKSELALVSEELQASKSTQEKTSQLNAEKEENLKRIKIKNEELMASEAATKKLAAKYVKDREEIEAKFKTLLAQCNTSESQLKEYEENHSVSVIRIKELEGSLADLAEKYSILLQKMEETENTLRIQERKNTQIIKDLQKQLGVLTKDRKKDDTASSSSETLGPEKFIRGHSSKPSGDYGANRTLNSSFPRPLISVSEGLSSEKKDKQLTEDFLKLSKENELLNQRASNAENQVRRISEHIGKLNDELEIKGKVIQQYVLRENADKIQPEDRHRLNLNIFSSLKATEKLDPHKLASVNSKLQKLLEEMTTKTVMLEEELRKRKGSN